MRFEGVRALRGLDDDDAPLRTTLCRCQISVSTSGGVDHTNLYTLGNLLLNLLLLVVIIGVHELAGAPILRLGHPGHMGGLTPSP